MASNLRVAAAAIAWCLVCRMILTAPFDVGVRPFPSTVRTQAVCPWLSAAFPRRKTNDDRRVDVAIRRSRPKIGLTTVGDKGFPGNRRGVLTIGGSDEVDLNEQELLNALSSKAGTRFVLDGGPMHQPHPFFILRRDPQAQATLREPTYDSDSSYDRRIIPATAEQEFQQIARNFLDGHLPPKLMFKPNQSADGRGIMQLVRTGPSMVTLRMAWRLGHPDPFPPTTAVINRIEEKNYGKVQFRRANGLVEIQIRGSTQELQAALVDLWRTATIRQDVNTYDAGIVEAWQDYLDYEDEKAFEIRLAYFGDLGDGSIKEFLRDSPQGTRYTGSRGKIGSSAVMSNVTHRPEARSLTYDEALKTLAKVCGIPTDRIPALDRYLQDLVAKESRYRADRLRAAGFQLSVPIYGEFDVRFLLPRPGDEFPRVSLIESLVRRVGDRPFGTRVSGRTLSAA